MWDNLSSAHSRNGFETENQLPRCFFTKNFLRVILNIIARLVLISYNYVIYFVKYTSTDLQYIYITTQGEI